MAKKKKAKASAKRKKAATKKAARKKTAKRKVKKVAKKKVARKKVAKKKATRKTARKKTAKKATKRKTAKKPAARKTTRKPKVAAQPKAPRRTLQAAPPPPRIDLPPIVDVTPTPLITPPPFAAPPPPMPQAGEDAPDFELPDQSGRLHSLRQYRGRKVVLYFYPKDDTPGCTTEACGFRDTQGPLTDRNAVVLGVSPDAVASHEKFVQKYGLTFPLLADEDHAVAERYGVWVEKSLYGRTSMGIARTTFVIDEQGRIAQVFRNVRADGHAQEVLAKL